MLVCGAGDVHGNLDQLYALVERMEEELGRRVDLVVQVGDLGVWPDPSRVDRATRAHDGPGEFHRWWRSGGAAPRPTIFVPGNHEDFQFLLDCESREVLPDLFFLPWGEVTSFEVRSQRLRIGGIGGCFSPTAYVREHPEEPKKRLQRKRRGSRTMSRRAAPPPHTERLALMPPSHRKHYLRLDEDALMASVGAGLDVLLLHESPTERLDGYRRDGSVSRSWRCDGAAGLGEVVAHTRPRVCLHGHYHAWHPRSLEGIPVVSLQKVMHHACGMGGLLLLDIPSTGSIRAAAVWDGERPRVLDCTLETVCRSATQLGAGAASLSI